ncbi:MAG: HPP family protein [Chloroflexi bacterium]|jgi:CBS-domain-containing membrane protein|nr:HPP family protein [Chloroflexota bacterium]MBT7080708.1 HPP family protein [Chloroflexota bacterium]MBT7290278.1 HPP family protein [Chloroflexota bacterium]
MPSETSESNPTKPVVKLIRRIKNSLIKIDSEFKQQWHHYLIQSVLAALCFMLVLWVFNDEEMVITTSIGASTFIVFAMPKAVTAQPRSLIGGYLIGLAVGSLSLAIPHETFLPTIAVYAAVVGVAMLLMVVTDTEHPPACGIALGVAISGWSWWVGLTIVITAVILTIVHISLARYLKDLV